MVRTPASGTGTRVAQEYYGARGFVIHHNTDLWGDAEPIDGYHWGIWPMGGRGCRSTRGTTTHSRRIGSFCKTGHGRFCTMPPVLLDYSGRRRLRAFGHWAIDLTGEQLSPAGWKYTLVDHAPTMDIEILRELFTRTMDAGNILHEDAAFLKQVEDARGKLPPFAIGKQANCRSGERTTRSLTWASPYFASVGALSRNSNLP